MPERAQSPTDSRGVVSPKDRIWEPPLAGSIARKGVGEREEGLKVGKGLDMLRALEESAYSESTGFELGEERGGESLLRQWLGIRVGSGREKSGRKGFGEGLCVGGSLSGSDRIS